MRIHAIIKERLGALLCQLETKLEADMLTIFSPIRPGLEHSVRDAIEAVDPKRKRLAIMLQTGGGIIEIVERMVHVVRKAYDEVWFVVPDRAMSAGTVFVMSGDEILMDSFSVLGPIDPQVEKTINGKQTLVPALAYINQYENLVAKSAAGTLTTAEYAMLTSLDLAELQTFVEARELSIELLTTWLKTYKFRNWKTTRTASQTVTDVMREERAAEIATILSDNKKWHSHSRGISMAVLSSELPGEVRLRIQDFGTDKELAALIRSYSESLAEHMMKEGYATFVHSRGYF